MRRIKFLYERDGVASGVPQFRGIMEETIMDRETNTLVELGSVSVDTAGPVRFGIELGGKEEDLGLRQD